MQNEQFITSEHYAGFHDKVQEGCYECVRENRLIQSFKTVNVKCECHPECIGCGTKENVTKCDETMCYQCWSNENNDE